MGKLSISKVSGLLLALLLCCNIAEALELPDCFSDHMVLQRNATTRIWGRATRGQKVIITASWSDKDVVVGAGDSGKWSGELSTPAAGGPYQLQIRAGNEVIVLKDVLVGEVWLCSGQSNMVFGAAFGLKEMVDELPHAQHPGIRFLNVSRKNSSQPLDTLSDTWQLCDSASASQFSAIGYFAAKALNEELHVPIGIISSCAGSTTVESWTPAYVFHREPSLLLLTNHYFNLGEYWNAMIHPLAGFRIAGVFWYQGESNVISYAGYEHLLNRMVTSWRRDWGYEFPFFQVQIAPYAYSSQKVFGNKAAFLREQQVNALTSISKTGLVVVTDLVPDVNQIHPPKKKAVAERLVRLAEAEVYGMPLKDYKSPIYDRFNTIGQKMIIRFKYVNDGLRIDGDRLEDIFIAGADSVFYPARALARGNTLEVSSPHVLKPVAVRFGFTDTACPNLFNRKGLPVGPFRTDHWNIP